MEKNETILYKMWIIITITGLIFAGLPENRKAALVK